MRVSKAIELLSRMKPDDEIVIEWWDIDCFHGAIVDPDGDEMTVIPREVWDAFAGAFTTREHIIESVYEDIQWGLQDYCNELLKGGE